VHDLFKEIHYLFKVRFVASERLAIHNFSRACPRSSRRSRRSATTRARRSIPGILQIADYMISIMF